MSFNLVKPNQNIVDVRLSYKHIAEEFCKYYYTLYDANFSLLASLYYPQSQFTYQHIEVSGFDNLLNFVGYDTKFTHHNLNVAVQPIGHANLMITVTGTITMNDSIFQHRFVETLFIQKDDCNRLKVFGTVFKVIE